MSASFLVGALQETARRLRDSAKRRVDVADGSFTAAQSIPLNGRSLPACRRCPRSPQWHRMAASRCP